MISLADLAVGVWQTVEGTDKTTKSREAAEGQMAIGEGSPPDRPARPSTPELLLPNEMPRRRGQSD